MSTVIKHSIITAEAPNVYDGLKYTLANLAGIEAHHAANSKPTLPEYQVSSFNHKYATLRGYKYHYVEEGNPDGEPLILLHGFPDMWYGMRYQIRHLAKQNYRVIAVDSLGSGESDCPRCDDGNYDQYRPKNIAANMIALLDHLNIPKAVFIGHDWGASTCWSVGLFHPERCRAVISIGIPYMEPQVEYADPKDLQKVFPQFQYFAVFQTKEPEGWFDGNSHTMAVAMLNSVYGPSVGTSVEEKQLYIDSFTRTTMHGGLNYYRATRLSFEDGLPYVGKPYTVPAMLIIVESDPIVTPAFVASHTHGTIQSLEQARIKEGGHNVQTENPEEVNKLIDGYLAKVFDKKQGLGKQTIEE